MSTSPYLEDLGFMLVQFRKLEHSAAMGGRTDCLARGRACS